MSTNIDGDLILDAKAMLIDLNNSLNNDFSIMDQEELDSALAKIIYAEEKLVFNVIDWSLSKLHLISPNGLKSVTDLRMNLTTMSPDALASIDPMAPLVLDVVNKLDALDTTKKLADILLKALSI